MLISANYLETIFDAKLIAAVFDKRICDGTQSCT